MNPDDMTNDELRPEDMSIEQLEAAINLIGEQQRALAAEKRGLQSVLSGKLLVADAERKLAQMNDDEKSALLQTLQAQGIIGAEQFGKI